MAQRTSTQNNAMHLYFELLAQALNDSGLDIRKTLKEDFDIPWTEKTVKELIWRPVQQAMYEIDSTAKLDKMQVNDVYEVINKDIAEKHGIHIPFPSEEDLQRQWR